MTTAYVNLTRTERDALMDRLDMPSNIAEALTDVSEGETPPVLASEEAVKTRAVALAGYVRSTCCVPSNLDDLSCAILVESIEGSLYIANVESHETTLRRVRARTMRNIVAKFVAAGIAEEDEITIPLA